MTRLFSLISIHNLFIVVTFCDGCHDFTYLQLNYELWKNLVSKVTYFLQDKQAIHLVKTATNWCGQTGFPPIQSKPTEVS